MILLDNAIEADEVIKEANKLIETINGFLPKVLQFAINVLVALAILFVGRLIIKYLLKFADKFMKKANVEISVAKFLNSFFKATLYIVLVVIICGQVGIETTSIVAVISSAGLALGLAIQGSLSNLAGGVLILALKPFKVGDYIYDGSCGNEGTVNKIDLFYTYLNTIDNKKLVIPNGSLANTYIINASANEKRRVDFQLGISYTSNIDQARKVILETVDKEKLVLKQEEIFVFIQELAASQVTVGVRVWTLNANYWTVYFNLNEAFKKAFDQAGIEIPFNQLSVHIEESK